MKYLKSFILIQLLTVSVGFAQRAKPGSFLSNGDLIFLEGMTKDVLEASRIHPDQFISKEFGSNKTGETLIRPGGRDAYPSFWIRDYAMSLETGLVPRKEQLHMLMLTASTQSDQAWITKGGSLVPYGAIADHVRIDDGKPIYFPGTYSYEGQGTPDWGMLPPYCDQFYFVHMAHYYVKQTGDYKILLKEANGTRLIDRLKTSFHVPPSDVTNHIVKATEAIRGVDFGFRDAQAITGNLCFPSILKYRAAMELSEMLQRIKSNDAGKYRQIASTIKETLPKLFMDNRGMLMASTGKSKQADVWSTALAVYLGMLEGENLSKASSMLAKAYKAGTLSYKGNVRHILTTDDYNEKTAWEVSLSAKNTYQNGAYWGTPTGWVCYAINQVDPTSAKALANEFMEDLKTNDYRKGGNFGAPYECFNQGTYTQNPIYLTTVACPLVAFRKMR
ncbi:hypothetical protein [Dyadobacter sp. LHD-138]|uniref:hypothetical protein n=1 Tax=Dyadobacter sp. LHD-138 TaxID=3071413 RepID=UPI0027E19359|nr:hypothetical protein [Dyadobacter sp. LHD-138]MDQ6480655.1 hypothetical protein [Dyadobacter sp. LHD-138]